MADMTTNGGSRDGLPDLTHYANYNPPKVQLTDEAGMMAEIRKRPLAPSRRKRTAAKWLLICLIPLLLFLAGCFVVAVWQ